MGRMRDGHPPTLSPTAMPLDKEINSSVPSPLLTKEGLGVVEGDGAYSPPY